MTREIYGFESAVMKILQLQDARVATTLVLQVDVCNFSKVQVQVDFSKFSSLSSIDHSLEDFGLRPILQVTLLLIVDMSLFLAHDISPAAARTHTWTAVVISLLIFFKNLIVLLIERTPYEIMRTISILFNEFLRILHQAIQPGLDLQELSIGSFFLDVLLRSRMLDFCNPILQLYLFGIKLTLRSLSWLALASPLQIELYLISSYQSCSFLLTSILFGQHPIQRIIDCCHFLGVT
jgi:hypothetical protein